jgi:hypothetical protein
MTQTLKTDPLSMEFLFLGTLFAFFILEPGSHLSVSETVTSLVMFEWRTDIVNCTLLSVVAYLCYWA